MTIWLAESARVDGSAQKTASPLVVGDGPGLRRHYVRLLTPDHSVVEASPEDLGHPERLLDTAPVIVCLGDRETVPEWLDAVRALPGASETLLITAGTEEAVLESVLECLEPAHVMAHPAPKGVLDYFVRRTRVGAERTARVQHRPARALLGVSSAIRDVLDQVAQAAPTRVPVLILGETGTGKELVARAIHEQGDRASKRFVAVNCGALAENLLEAELFGYKKGAFTGADRDRHGLFQEAHDGTLFLDEVGDTTPALQTKLLRVLETGEVRPVGATEARQVDVRIVSATHRDLAAGVQEGTFRQDLLYRLNTLTLFIPPLRRRRVDIPFLAQHFAEEFGDEQARRITLDEDFLDALAQRDLPGNVRELRNLVERAITLAGSEETLGLEHLPADPHGRPAHLSMGTLRDRVMQVEIQAIREALERFDGNRTHAAEALGISRVSLRKKIRSCGLE